MSLDFTHGGYEGLFRQALKQGINLFCGAGFSVEAQDYSDSKLPVGIALLRELQDLFPDIRGYRNLPRACTKITQTDKETFYSFLSNRFKVNKFNPLYNSLLDINLKNIYTTNIDDLFFRIFECSDKPLYLNDISQQGAAYTDKNVIHYFPLHGCVRTPGNYVFGATEIASAFSIRGNEKSWQSLAKDAEKHALLFWGWNFDDAGPIEAMYRKGNRPEANTNRWVLLYEPDEETIDYLESLKFNIIVGNTLDMLQYISDFMSDEKKKSGIETYVELEKSLIPYQIPANDDNLPSYPLKDFFLEYLPRWSHIYSNTIPKTNHYKRIANSISNGANVIVIGIRGSGKTTLMMQLLADYVTELPKHYMVAPSLEQAQTYIRLLGDKPSILFVDDCFRDTNAIIELFSKRNIQVVCFDRDFNYERQFFNINNMTFELVEVTEISKEDAQSIANIIPADLKRKDANTKNFDKDPTIITLLATHMKDVNFKFLDVFSQKDWDAARVFLMIAYVHACGTPCSFDMVYSFLGDEEYTWQDMFDIIERAGKLISDITDNLWEYDIKESLQNYYQCRSRYFAEKIISGLQTGNKLFASVLSDFIKYVPPFKVCMFDKFKRRSFDADFASRAFPNIEDGEEYYNMCAEKDESEYLYQQAALYFSRKGEYKIAFQWIDKSRNLVHYNRFSIDSTYAQIYFDANIGVDSTQAAKALEILYNCCTNDKRKSIHFAVYAECCLRYYECYQDEKAITFLKTALGFVKEGLDSKNMSLGNKNKWWLSELNREIEKILA